MAHRSVLAVLLLSLTSAAPAAGSDAYAEGRSFFHKKKYREALERFLDARASGRTPRDLGLYVEECLRRLDEPWLAGSAVPSEARLLSLLADRRRAARALADKRGELLSSANPSTVRFAASVYGESDGLWREAVLGPLKDLLSTFPDAALVLECRGPAQAHLLAASARLAQALVDRGAVVPANAAVVVRASEEAFCLVTAGSTRTLALPRSSEAPVPALQAKEQANGDFMFDVLFPDPAAVTAWSLSLRDAEGRVLREFPGAGAGFVETVSWRPEGDWTGPVTAVARITTPQGSWEGTEGPLSLSKPAAKAPAEPLAPAESLHRQVVHFEDGTATLRGGSWRFLRRWGRDILPSNPGARAVITGCASREESRRLPALAEERARRVRDLLTGEFGVESARLETRAGDPSRPGEDAPVAFLFLQ